MSETQALLGKIAALRQRLEQVQGLARESGAAAATLTEDWGPNPAPAQGLERQVLAGTEHDLQLDRLVRPLSGPLEDPVRAMPSRLTARARRLLERGRELLAQLRDLSDAFATPAEPGPVPNRLGNRLDPLAVLYRRTVALTDTSLRMVTLFPETATAQLQLCEGLEVILETITRRVGILMGAVDRFQREAEQVHLLTALLSALMKGQSVDLQAFITLAEDVLADAQEGLPLRFLEGDASRPAPFAACHSLTVARVLARVVRHDPELRSRPVEAVLAALVHDAGMVEVPSAVLAHPGPLDADQRRALEAHCRAGAVAVVRMMPEASWLAEAALSHHERCDGTGYPDGLREFQMNSLTRMLAVCDVYAAQCAARPHRLARETRTAMADTLLLAEQGALDRSHAEHLLQLSFYPIGSVVELADGAVGMVVATPIPRRDLGNPARPVVALLTDPQGTPLPLPRHLDLAESDHPGIVRTLSAAQRRETLGSRWPEWT